MRKHIWEIKNLWKAKNHPTQFFVFFFILLAMQNPDVKPHTAERSLTFELRPLKVSFFMFIDGLCWSQLFYVGAHGETHSGGAAGRERYGGNWG